CQPSRRARPVQHTHHCADHGASQAREGGRGGHDLALATSEKITSGNVSPINARLPIVSLTTPLTLAAPCIGKSYSEKDFRSGIAAFSLRGARYAFRHRDQMRREWTGTSSTASSTLNGR